MPSRVGIGVRFDTACAFGDTPTFSLQRTFRATTSALIVASRYLRKSQKEGKIKKFHSVSTVCSCILRARSLPSKALHVRVVDEGQLCLLLEGVVQLAPGTRQHKAARALHNAHGQLTRPPQLPGSRAWPLASPPCTCPARPEAPRTQKPKHIDAGEIMLRLQAPDLDAQVLSETSPTQQDVLVAPCSPILYPHEGLLVQPVEQGPK